MKILPLVISPDPLLKEISQEIENVDDDLRVLMNEMVNTMYHEKGIGLATVQVGHLKRVLVIDVDYEAEDHDHDHSNHHNCGEMTIVNSKPQYFINPKIISFSENKSAYKEGCLSFPGARAEVIRPQKIKLKFLDYHGKERIEEFGGILATCLQHEIDHLNGITFVDHISYLKRDLILKKMNKMRSK